MSEKNYSNSANIIEIFESLQGEGINIGENQLFIRFSGCNLSCNYCDTNHTKEISTVWSVEKLLTEIENFKGKTIALTGGEPLLHAEFLKELLPKIEKSIYLETNGTLPDKLAEIIDLVDIVAMDIKLQSSTGQKNQFEANEKFTHIASQKISFIKVVFDENIKDEEIEATIEIAKKYNLTIILQPKMPMSQGFKPEEIFYKFFGKYKNIRLIPQVHKFLNIR
jgi:organic radical activating enzyme